VAGRVTVSVILQRDLVVTFVAKISRVIAKHLPIKILNLLSTKIYTLQLIRRAQVKVGLINLCKGLFSLNARIYYKLKSGT
jgi:hypothetical protein